MKIKFDTSSIISLYYAPNNKEKTRINNLILNLKCSLSCEKKDFIFLKNKNNKSFKNPFTEGKNNMTTTIHKLSLIFKLIIFMCIFKPLF